MSYRITGLARGRFAHLFAQSDAELAAQGIVRVTADRKPGFPCRVTLEDAEPGETLLLLNHADHDVATPFRNAYAIYVRESAGTALETVDAPPPVFAGRTIALRAYDAAGMLHAASLAPPGEADARIRALFSDAGVAYIHAHNAAAGCFAARIDRN